MLLKVPLKVPNPDIENFCNVIKKEVIPNRPPLLEHCVPKGGCKMLVWQSVGKKKRYVIVVVLLACLISSLSFTAAASAAIDSVSKKWDFEDGKASGVDGREEIVCKTTY